MGSQKRSGEERATKRHGNKRFAQYRLITIANNTTTNDNRQDDEDTVLVVPVIRLTRPGLSDKRTCKKKHQEPFVECVEAVVYNLPLKCGKNYVRQSGRCLNKRLREHRYNAAEKRGGFLDAHCRHCNCTVAGVDDGDHSTCAPAYRDCSIVGRARGRITREIIEAEMIDRLGDNCVSKSSITLSRKELSYLRNAV
nr:uncharacterized protein LOC129380598 isoform X1 [Dermacentor andersoni]